MIKYIFLKISLFTLFLSIKSFALTTTVTTTLDSGLGSLRQAITDINTAGQQSNIILFNIPGVGPFTIAPASALPTINFPTNINGYSQPGTNILTRSSLIVLDGIFLAPGINGLEITSGANGSIIQGLIIERFAADGIFMNNSEGNKIIANVIGSPYDPTLGNGNNGVEIVGRNNLISCNIIGNNGRLNTASGILVNGLNSIGNVIISNIDFSNSSNGITLLAQANNNQSYPIITSADSNGSFLKVNGTLKSLPNTLFRIQIFTLVNNRNPITEGQLFEAQVNLITDNLGNGSFSAIFASLAQPGNFVSATATRLSGANLIETSEYSLNKIISQNSCIINPFVSAMIKKYCTININVTELCG